MDNLNSEQFAAGLKALQSGTPLPAVLNMYAANDKELARELNVAALMFSIPKKLAPLPVKQFKFQGTTPHHVWHGFSWRSLIMVPTAVFLVFTSLYGGVLASNSTPGQKLFAIKKAYEKAQLALTTDPDSKAQLQLSFNQKRLSEAESVIYGPNNNPKLEAAALAELSAQTKTTAEAFKGNTNISPKTAASLEALSSDIASLSQTKTSPTTSSTPTVAQKVEDLKKILTTAQETNLTTLDPSLETISVNGKVQNIQDNIIYLENYAWEVNDKTSFIKGTDKASLKDITKALDITINGVKQNQHFIATNVIINVPEKPTPKVEAKINPQTDISSEPLKVVGKIIVEDPSPQYAP
jgi:uncharacterized protein YcbK (DUF882 family)